LAVVLITAGLLVGPPSPAGADENSDSACLAHSRGTLSTASTEVTWTEDIVVQWRADLYFSCSLYWVVLVGPRGEQTTLTTGRPSSGSTVIRADMTGTWALRLLLPGGRGRDLAGLGLTVRPDGPLTDGSTEVTIIGDWLDQRRMFVRAVQTEGVTVRIVGDVNLDLSGIESLHIASRVRIIGDRTVFSAGPRIFTRTFPEQFLVIGDTTQSGNHVHITGIRLDGGESDDPFSAVGQSDSDGIAVYSSTDVQIDHNELYRWRGAAVNVHDGDSQDPSNNRDLIHRSNAQTMWIHDNYIHHNQHPSTNVCGSGFIDGGGHAGGYGVVVSTGGFALIERNVFDWNRHAIAGDGKWGSGYLAYRNLILPNGGVHFRCVDADPDWTWLINPFWVPIALVLTDDGIYHTHAIDMHGTQCSLNCGPAGDYMDIRYNTILYTAGNAIHLRGTPRDEMEVRNNVFAHEDLWAGIFNGVMSPGALLQNQTGLHQSGNITGLNTFNNRKRCDFDGDGLEDDFIATGVTWWYASSAMGGRWTYVAQSATGINAITLSDVDHDGFCDITADGRTTPGTGIGLSSSAAVARGQDGRLWEFRVGESHRVWYRSQTATGTDTWSVWRQFNGPSMSTIAAELNGNGLVEVFGVEWPADSAWGGKVYHRWQLAPNADSWSEWAQLDGRLSTVPGRLSVAASPIGGLVLFGINTVGELWGRRQYIAPSGDNGGSWSPWGQLGLMDRVAVRNNGTGRFEVFGITSSWHLLYSWELAPITGSWAPWVDLGGPRSGGTALPLPATLAATTMGLNGAVVLFAADKDGAVWGRTQYIASNGSNGIGSWSPWSRIDGSFSTIAATYGPGNRLELFGVDDAGRPYRRWELTPGTGTWSPWTDQRDPLT
jgi:hypothetical protein